MSSREDQPPIKLDAARQTTVSSFEPLTSVLNKQPAFGTKRVSEMQAHPSFVEHDSRPDMGLSSLESSAGRERGSRPNSMLLQRSSSLFTNTDTEKVAVDGRFGDAKKHSPMQKGHGANVVRASRLIRSLSYDDGKFESDDSDFEDMTPPRISLSTKYLEESLETKGFRSMAIPDRDTRSTGGAEDAMRAYEGKSTLAQTGGKDLDLPNAGARREQDKSSTVIETPYKLPPRPPQSGVSGFKFNRRKQLGLKKPKRAEHTQGQDDDTFESQLSFGSESSIAPGYYSSNENVYSDSFDDKHGGVSHQNFKEGTLLLGTRSGNDESNERTAGRFEDATPVSDDAHVQPAKSMARVSQFLPSPPSNSSQKRLTTTTPAQGSPHSSDKDTSPFLEQIISSMSSGASHRSRGLSLNYTPFSPNSSPRSIRLTPESDHRHEESRYAEALTPDTQRRASTKFTADAPPCASEQ
ncbi:hypothetical protein EV182_000724 [Spiromyces aspiralis]|uniref:Uncharacterized protein n=1 Tax=Spiromyces aspiralis TaxID=68401 RepID=A0ACC1HH82_9FUNG|nr:hypothetical protein EV182_000724 [Spiromyces aspiralis]